MVKSDHFYITHIQNSLSKIYSYIQDIDYNLNYNIVPEDFQDAPYEHFEHFMPNGFFSIVESSGKISLVETIEQLIILFKLDRFKGEIAYMQAFQDLVLEFSQHMESTVQ